MVHYKLTYFCIRGYAECIRQIFALADQKFEDVRLTKEEFAPLKSSFPFGQVPVLEVDGRPLAQSMTICRYLATTFGFAGNTPLEAAIIDSLVDQFVDYRNEMKSFYYASIGLVPGDVEKLKTEVLLPARDKFLGFLTKFLKKNSSGYLVGDKISWADVVIADHISDIITRAPEYLDGFLEVKAHMELVHQNPNIKKWLETRPVTAH